RARHYHPGILEGQYSPASKWRKNCRRRASQRSEQPARGNRLRFRRGGTGIIEHSIVNGISIPDDLVVVGSDGLARSRSPLMGMTTIVQPVVEMAKTAFSVLLEHIGDPGVPVREVICRHQIHTGTS